MASFMIVCLPPNIKSLKAVEFIQKNGFSFRISSNLLLMDFLMSSGGGDSQLTALTGPSGHFEPGKEELEVVDGLTNIFNKEIKTEVESDENSPPFGRVIKVEDVPGSDQPDYPRLEMTSIGVLTEEFAEVPMVASKDPSPTAVVKVENVENENFTEIYGDLKPVVEQGAHHVLTALGEAQLQPEERKEQNSLGEKEVEEERMEDRGECDMTMDEPCEATNTDVRHDDGLAADDVHFEEDVLIGCVRVIRDYSEGNEEDMEEDGKMEESDEEEEELIEEQADEHQSVHTEEKPFACSLCGKGFASKKYLKIHEKIHEEGKHFKCDHCDYRSAHKYRLKAHNVVHTGERPFECQECGSRFSQRSSLNTHIRLHSGQKPYSCKNCDKKYIRNDFLKKHMKSKHAEENFDPTEVSKLVQLIKEGSKPSG